MSAVQELNDRFAMPGVVEVINDRGGLPAVWIEGSAKSHGATGTIYLHGAHLAAWHPPNTDEVLWLSEKSLWQAGKAIRGGVPICFPWFGPNKNATTAPAHGFARLRPWELISVVPVAEGIAVTLESKPDEFTRGLWPQEFLLRHRITIGRDLIMSLELTDTGTSPLTAEEAQHTYFSVGDVRQVRVGGLDGVRYIDKVDGLKENVQEGDITITGETDRVYLNTQAPLMLDDPVKKRRISLTKDHSLASVIWNPWIAKAKAMADFGDQEWHSMICMETCNVGQHAITLAPGERHIMTSRISVQPY